eukprot:PhM_4_TR16658/c0_g2_i1/m.70080
MRQPSPTNRLLILLVVVCFTLCCSGPAEAFNSTVSNAARIEAVFTSTGIAAGFSSASEDHKLEFKNNVAAAVATALSLSRQQVGVTIYVDTAGKKDSVFTNIMVAVASKKMAVVTAQVTSIAADPTTFLTTAISGSALVNGATVALASMRIISLDCASGTLELKGNFFPQMTQSRLTGILATALEVEASTLNVQLSDVSSTDGSTTFYLTGSNVDSPTRAMLTLVKKLDDSHFQVSEIDMVSLQMTSGGVTGTVYRAPTAATATKKEENSMWWMVFLVLLLPIISVLIRQAYRKGKKRERRRNAEAMRSGSQPGMGMSTNSNNNNMKPNGNMYNNNNMQQQQLGDVPMTNMYNDNMYNKQNFAPNQPQPYNGGNQQQQQAPMQPQPSAGSNSNFIQQDDAH